jgi:hypothetical protein
MAVTAGLEPAGAEVELAAEAGLGGPPTDNEDPVSRATVPAGTLGSDCIMIEPASYGMTASA